MTTPREHFLLREIEKRDKIIRAFSKAKPIKVGLAKPQPVQGRLNLDRFPVTEFAMGEGRHIPLPGTLDDIAESIGREPALKLAEALSQRQTGSRGWRVQVYVPQRAMTDNHPLVAILGRMLAEQLQETHANLILEIPRCAEIQQAYREHVARQMFEAGQTPEDVAECGTVTLERAKQIREAMA